METPKPSRNKDTVDVYRDLLRVEVRSLVQRVGELTQTVGDLFTEVNHIAIQLESSTVKGEQSASGVQYCRTELSELKRMMVNCESRLTDIHERTKRTEDKLADLEVQVVANSVLQGS